MQSLHSELVTHRPDFKVEPFFSIELTNEFGLNALINRFDKKQRTDSYIINEFWDQYTSDELNSRNIGHTTSTAVQNINGVTGNARAMIQDGRPVGFSGLELTHRNIKYQIRASAGKQIANPADIIMLDAQRRETGKPLIDPRSYTRFPQIKPKRVGVNPRTPLYFPSAASRDGQLVLANMGGGAGSNVGVRFLVGSEA